MAINAITIGHVKSRNLACILSAYTTREILLGHVLASQVGVRVNNKKYRYPSINILLKFLIMQ